MFSLYKVIFGGDLSKNVDFLLYFGMTLENVIELCALVEFMNSLLVPIWNILSLV